MAYSGALPGLSRRFTRVPAEEVDRIVRECYSEFEGRPIREFVPMLVERTARKRLGRFDPLPLQTAESTPKRDTVINNDVHPRSGYSDSPSMTAAHGSYCDAVNTGSII